jgi:hypothetical protein
LVKDCAAVTGFALLITGVGLLSVPAALIVAGGLLCSAGVWGYHRDPR